MNTRYDPYYPTHYRKENIPDVPRPKTPPISQIPQPSKKDKVSVGSWMGTMLLSAIPIVNIICFFVWAFGTKTKPSKKTYAAACLIWILIGIILIGVALVVMVFVLNIALDQFFKSLTDALQ